MATGTIPPSGPPPSCPEGTRWPPLTSRPSCARTNLPEGRKPPPAWLLPLHSTGAAGPEEPPLRPAGLLGSAPAPPLSAVSSRRPLAGARRQRREIRNGGGSGSRRGDVRHDATPLETKLKNLNAYSPTTGTREMSPFSSPMSHDAQTIKKHLSNGNRTEQNGSASRLPRRGQPQTEKDVFMELQCKVKSSLDRILKIRGNLTSLQALEGSRELENVGVSVSSGNLRDEVRKTQELMSQAEELQLLKRDHGKLLAQRKECHCALSGLVNWLSRNILSELNEFTGCVQTTSSSAFLKSLLD
ncbi:centromere protein R [Pezoporus occidentalis]|uniref:centromere protein R n=1 Tax=Pezoporus occidentalis TaxID=407982 RepID=UPI002F919883